MNVINRVKEGKLEYITFKILDQYSNKLAAKFFLKNGGCSTGIYSSLNFRLFGQDEKAIQNYKYICNKYGLENIYKASQNHTNNILIIDNKNRTKYEYAKINKEEYDAYITKDRKIATCITTADCNPIVIYDPKNNVVANIHSGWKGTTLQIYLKTAQILKEKFNSKFSDLIVCIGPSIGKCCFTSKEIEFKNIFTKIWPNESEYISKENDTYHIDLIYLIKNDLIKLGVKPENIVSSGICTSCNQDICYSYRAAVKNKQTDYATMGTITYLR